MTSRPRPEGEQPPDGDPEREPGEAPPGFLRPASADTVEEVGHHVATEDDDRDDPAHGFGQLA